jgi:hypothetical protein
VVGLIRNVPGADGNFPTDFVLVLVLETSPEKSGCENENEDDDEDDPTWSFSPLSFTTCVGL